MIRHFKHSYGFGSGKYDYQEYFAVPKETNSELSRKLGGDYRPMVAMTARIEHAKEVPNFEPDITGTKMNVSSEYGELTGDKNGSPETLFTHVPKKTTITGAYAHPSMRFSVLPLAAQIHREHGELTSDDNLSQFSSDLVQNAIKRGLPVKPSASNPELKIQNTQNFSNNNIMPPSFYEKLSAGGPDIKEYSPNEMKEAKQHLKTMLGHPLPNKKPITRESTQLQLPGIE